MSQIEAHVAIRAKKPDTIHPTSCAVVYLRSAPELVQCAPSDQRLTFEVDVTIANKWDGVGGLVYDWTCHVDHCGPESLLACRQRSLFGIVRSPRGIKEMSWS